MPWDVPYVPPPARRPHPVEKPASEKGAQATLNKAGTEFKRLGADVGSKLATLGKWGFGRK